MEFRERLGLEEGNRCVDFRHIGMLMQFGLVVLSLIISTKLLYVEVS